LRAFSCEEPTVFSHYLTLAVYSFKRSRALTALMILAIGLGIGASMTMLTVLHVMSGDPLPERSAHLYVPAIDPRPLSHTQARTDMVDIPMTWPDTQSLLHAARADRQAAMAGAALPVSPTEGSLRPFYEFGHYVTADFFPMFATPFRAGSGWSAQDDAAHARVVVLNGPLARKLFGNTSAIGHTVRLKNTDFRIVGVLDDWQPQPTFYAQIDDRAFGNADQFLLPLQTAVELDLNFDGRMSCWGSAGGDARLSDQCAWLQFWVELDSPAKARAYRTFLADYWRDQQKHGRFPRPVDARLYDLMGWLSNQHVVPGDLRLQSWLALGFLAVCIVNIVGLLLAKFLRRSGEISVRRALGARRRDVFLQLGIEAGVIGLAGGLLGLGFAEGGLWLVRQQPDGYAQLARMDAAMLLVTFGLAVLASVLAGLLPAWRACNVMPALQLKTQ
jgi:putative ABC transport system permease protein